MYFDNSVTCKVTTSRGVRDWQLNRGEEIFTTSRDRREICTCMSRIFHASRSMTIKSANLYTSVFSCHALHSQSGYAYIYVGSMLLGHVYINI